MMGQEPPQLSLVLASRLVESAIAALDEQTVLVTPQILEALLTPLESLQSLLVLHDYSSVIGRPGCSRLAALIADDFLVYACPGLPTF